ncbi:hypothetical protein D9V30_10390 [Mycetocola reblochoni]|uniref:Uncharacterized protein n=2 Tax=Mycetocola reblochoni TaxID=331618 RepID=A0A1R4JNN1_9MICO|nr:hypothetical protein [Mycetocola reblochoni]RLP68389.1 hypothetical protein D9V30_10390 [Mycetocola reblochoni]SJN33871.1 hypothetical protein FM119_08620 [Mycetocola reblochoni REB411]
MAQLEFKEPPAHGRKKHVDDWKDTADQLRNRPGEWALVATDASPSMVRHIKAGTYIGMRPAGHFDAVSRGNRGSRADEIYARYIGGES